MINQFKFSKWRGNVGATASQVNEEGQYLQLVLRANPAGPV